MSSSFRSNPQKNADGIFSEFYGMQSPFGGMGGSHGGNPFPRSMFGDDISEEHVQQGITKKMKISRDVSDGTGRSTTVEEILAIEIRPGWKKGTKITFSEKGNEQRGVIPSDLVFIIDEKPHAVFKRDGNDLVVTQKISLAEALTSYTAQITTLDGRSLNIPVNGVISPTYEEVVKGEGMPIPKEQPIKGNLRIKFDIKYPTRLTLDQQKGIKMLLTSS
ncbi:DnaJ homolog subfamily B member 1 [Tanacetum coccineum]